MCGCFFLLGVSLPADGTLGWRALLCRLRHRVRGTHSGAGHTAWRCGSQGPYHGGCCSEGHMVELERLTYRATAQ